MIRMKLPLSYLKAKLLFCLLILSTLCLFAQSRQVFVDRSSNVTSEKGTSNAPCRTINCGVSFGGQEANIYIRQGSYPEILSILKPLKLIAKNGMVTIGAGANPAGEDYGFILQRIVQYAPEVRLHPDDLFQPSSVPWYLNHVRMRRHRTSIGPLWRDIQILDKGQVYIGSLVNQLSGGQSSGSGNKATNFFLEIEGDRDRVIRGNVYTAPCYVHYRKAPNGLDNDIQYWFFYPYSGDIALLDEGPDVNIAHEGDWEHITVRVDRNWHHIVKIFYAVHDDILSVSADEPFNFNYDLNLLAHPIVYSAKHSHASYPIAGEIKEFWANDHTADGGIIWKTWQNLILLGTKDNPLNGQMWLKYTGRWGEIGGNLTRLLTQATSGPYGPAFQDSWHNDEHDE